MLGISAGPVAVVSSQQWALVSWLRCRVGGYAGCNQQRVAMLCTLQWHGLYTN